MAISEGAPSKRPRSPNYPTVGLREAVDRVGRLYQKDNKAGAPPEMAAVHIGFGKPHGQAMSALAALKKFGLVTKLNGRIVPTQRAIEIINLPEADPRRHKAIRDAAMEPEIYRELIDQHRASGWPAEEVLASELVTYKGFIKNAADALVRDLFDSMEFAGLSDTSALESEQETDSTMEETIDQPKQYVSTRGHVIGAPPPVSAPTTKSGGIPKLSEISLPVGTSDDGEIVFAHVRFDSGIKRNLIASLRSLLEAMEKTLP